MKHSQLLQELVTLGENSHRIKHLVLCFQLPILLKDKFTTLRFTHRQNVPPPPHNISGTTAVHRVAMESTVMATNKTVTAMETQQCTL